MYKTFTADDYKKHLGLEKSYHIDGFLIYGGYANYLYDMLDDSLSRLNYKERPKRMSEEFLSSICEFNVMGKNYWYTVAYGGAMLSEHLHLACIFGSKKNILLGSCGGLKKGANGLEIIVPNYSYSEDSSAKSYQPNTGYKYYSDKDLTHKLINNLSKKFKVYNAPTVTTQAMLAETWDDVECWSKQGYYGVEMEAATVFATSNHFNVPSAAILRIGDNLIENKTILDVDYGDSRDLRRQITAECFDIALKEMIDS